MSASRMSTLCWIVFGVMCAAFLPLGYAVYRIGALPVPARVVLVVVVVGALWWGPFGYALYLTLAVIRKGDPRLLRRGVRGTAQVLTARATNTWISVGGRTLRMYRYGLRVSVPGREPYETECANCVPDLRPGQTVDVAVAPRNRRRVAIDVEDVRDDVPPQAYVLPETDVRFTVHVAQDGRSPNAERLDELDRLGRLHREGVLTDAEFAAEKARILGN